MQHILTGLILTAISSIVFAASCPTIAEIKNNKLTGWQLLDSEDHKPLNGKRAERFKDDILQFALAEWKTGENKKSNAIHCFYRDKNGSNLEAYLAKENFVPVQGRHWYQVSGALECAANNNMCQFQTIAPQTQLAKS